VVELEAGAASLQGFFGPPASMMLAEVYAHVGRVEEALVIVDEVLARIERSGAGQEAAELYRLKGEVILIRDSSATAQAEKCFRMAIEIAHGQSAKWWELRVTVSLGRLLRDTNRHAEAPRDALRNLQLVHRGLRHRRPEGRQAATERIEQLRCQNSTRRALVTNVAKDSATLRRD
jgi:hypothetical protein